MNLRLAMPDPVQTQDALSAALRDFLGAEARLEGWVARPVSKRGKHRALRYDLNARMGGAPGVRHYQWVGKFYEREDDARKVAVVLRELASAVGPTRGELAVPAVLAYHAPLRLLLLTYESGGSVIAALAQHRALVLPTLGRALALLHSTPIPLEGIVSAADVLDDLGQRVADLCARFPGEAVSLRRMFSTLEREAPGAPGAPSFLHGDLGPAQLLWQTGRVVVLDFDKCARGDPALDLGNLLTQLRRLTLRKPGKLRNFASLRQGLLEAYARESPPDSDLAARVAWYERVMLLRKIHFLALRATRHKEAETMRQRQAEAIGLLRELPALLESG
jgi:aminoglycoside phosphotransferase (APT) family kinase protein